MASVLDSKDMRLLTLLDENARYSNSQIARKVGLSKPAVEYRLRRLEKNNSIFEYYAVIDFTRLGYSQYKVYFRFQDATQEDEQSMIDYWKKDHNSIWVAMLRGRWDLAVSILARTNFEFGKILAGFMGQFSGFILEKDVLLTEYSPIYAREYLKETKPTEFVYGMPSQCAEIDGIDQRILKTLSTDARISIVDLARKTHLTRDTINYRLKKLTKEKIIVQYRCYPNLARLGICHHKIMLRTRNLSSQSERSIRAYMSQHKKATQFLKLIGSWDLELEFETENEDELYSIILDIRKRFSDVIRDYDILRITQVIKYDYFPF